MSLWEPHSGQRRTMLTTGGSRAIDSNRTRPHDPHAFPRLAPESREVSWSTAWLGNRPSCYAPSNLRPSGSTIYRAGVSGLAGSRRGFPATSEQSPEKEGVAPT